MLEYLSNLAPHFKRLNDPAQREKMFKIATVEIASTAAGLTAEQFIENLQNEIAKRENDPTNDRKNVLKGIIRDLHRGVEMDILRKRFEDLVKDVSAQEIAEIEQSLIDEGLPESEVKRLCDVHIEVFKHALEEQGTPRPPAGHPIHTYMVENRATENILDEINKLLETISDNPSKEKIKKHKQELSTLVKKLSQIDKHYLRKENQLFPRLESYNVSGPTQVMWAIHDDVRDLLKTAGTQISEEDLQVAATLRSLDTTIRDMIYKEEHILFPLSLETFNDSDWLQVLEGEEEIGYSWIEPMVEWKPEKQPTEKSIVLDKVELDIGNLTPSQVNLLLKHLPVDVTFVGADDRVAYYSGGKERIFARSPGIIGRSVSRCHPPKSVQIVESIVQAFKDGSRDVAEFWLQLGDRFIYIRYFAVREDTGKYCGTLEVSQDITEIKKLEGEQRLLDWTQKVMKT